MGKRLICLLLAASMVCSAGCGASADTPAGTEERKTEASLMEPTVALEETTAPGTEETEPETAVAPEPEPITERHYGVAMPYKKAPKISGVTITRYTPRKPKGENGVKPYDEFWLKTYVSGDLTGNPELAYSLTVSDVTRFVGIPEGYDRDALIRWGMSPGLNVEVLHRKGFTGKGAVIAYIDQPAAMHPEYDQGNLHYTNLTDQNNTMHGTTVLSMLMGKNIGTAPDAQVHFYGHASWKADYTTHIEALNAIMEKNKTLPEGEKITMVGFSDNIYSGKANMGAMKKAVKACEESGVMVFFCGDYASAAFTPMSDRNDYRNVEPDAVYGGGNCLLVPAGGRTGICTEAWGEYVYWSSGGLSWTMPYMLGLYAIATEIDPTLTKAELLSLAEKTAYQKDGRKIVNPVGFIARVLKDVGREEEARQLLEEAAYNHRYTYAVMNKSKMSKEDIRAVESYFARLTDTTVLVADVKNGVSALELYKALQADAWKRDGIVEGVQIFGTADMVSTFLPKYRVQMVNGVDEMGTIQSDLFYGNFLNEASQLKDYSVLDHFQKGWDVNLSPCWSVARLPLKKGEYKAYFSKYHSFLRETKLAQPELVNFSNPIFAQKVHTDDMGTFLGRAEKEFGILKAPYRLYGNLDGEYPVTGAVLGNFTPENLELENERGICEFIINSHGQKNNIDQAIFLGGKEKRISFLNTKTIDAVLDDHPYYLDCWTCNNGEGMKDNLTTAALKGKAVGVFSATHVISNNGVDCNASIDDLGKGNFYYFYLNYLSALNQGATRSRAFWFAQKAYADVLMEFSQSALQVEGNYQFNLCNLLDYHNFGVLEPKNPTKTVSLTGYAPDVAGKESTGFSGGQFIGNTLGDKNLQIHAITVDRQEDGLYRYTVEYTSDVGMWTFAFSPPNGDLFSFRGPGGNGSRQRFAFTLSREQIEASGVVMISFGFSDSCRAFVQVDPLELFGL